MSWTVNVIKNTLFVDEAHRPALIAKAGDEYHMIDFYKDMIQFDPDAMEHINFLDSQWAIDILQNAKANGTVIFGDFEGCDPYKIWGYTYTDGKQVKLTQKECLQIMLDDSE